MKKPVVVNVKYTPCDVYIDRRSIWGNPFKIGKDGTRAEVIKKYKEYANEKFSTSELRSLSDKTLGCWCAPLACHGDVLVEMVRKLK